MKAPIPMDTEGTASHAPSSLISPLIAGASCVALFAASSFLFAQTTFSCLSYTSIYYADEDAHHVSAQRRLGSMRGVMISSTLDEREREGEDEAVHIVYGSDEHSIVGVEASIRSVQAHASDPSRLNFYFFGDEALPSLPEVKWFNLTDVAINYDVDSFTNPTYERKGKHKRKDGITINTNAANYIRFIMDDLLPVSAKKALWIDSDTIVRCDVVQMIENTLVDSNYIIAAIPVKGPPLGLTRVHRPNYKDIRWTFNAGVMVVDLEKWRKGKMTEVMRRFALKNREDEIYKYGSQPPPRSHLQGGFRAPPRKLERQDAGGDRRGGHGCVHSTLGRGEQAMEGGRKTCRDLEIVRSSRLLRRRSTLGSLICQSRDTSLKTIYIF